MVGMALKSKQKKYIRKNWKDKSVTSMAKTLSVERREVKVYVTRLERKSGKKSKKSEIEWEWWKEADTMTMRGWFKGNKWILLGLGLLVMVLYGWTINHAFVSDDVFGIVDRDLSDWSLVWSNPLAFLRPLYYYIVNAIFGKSPAAFRFLNLLIHMSVVWVVYGLVERIYTKSAGVMAAVLVGIHPVMVESVTWISGGGHSQYSLFLLLSLGCFWWFMALQVVGSEKKRKWWLYAGSLAFFLLALITSEKAVVFPAMLLLVLVMMRRLRRDWKYLVPFGFLVGF